jgi:phytoene synthase
MSATTTVAWAYRHCEDVTRTEAANFYYGIRLLPADKRRAMCAVYAFARRVDDIGDGSLPLEVKIRELEAARAGIAAFHPGADDPVHAALGDACGRFPLPLDAFADLISGVEQDVHGTTYETFDDLVGYCRCVAGSIGRLCLSIFDASDWSRALPLADDLGVALQLTNILRDVTEDFGNGRVYLPAEDLRRFGCEGDLAAAPPLALAELIRLEAARDREWFARGLQLVELLDARSRSCVLAMAGIYRRILDRIEEDPAVVLRHRVSLPVWEKAWVAARSMTGATGRPVPTGRIRA